MMMMIMMMMMMMIMMMMMMNDDEDGVRLHHVNNVIVIFFFPLGSRVLIDQKASVDHGAFTAVAPPLKGEHMAVEGSGRQRHWNNIFLFCFVSSFFQHFLFRIFLFGRRM